MTVYMHCDRTHTSTQYTQELCSTENRVIMHAVRFYNDSDLQSFDVKTISIV